MYKSLNNKVALVTGAGTGIGRAIAQRLADEGANVLIVGRTETTLVETAAYSDKISYLAIDLESEDGIRTIIRTIGERYGRLDILVNNAGIIKRNDAIDYTEEDWDSVVFLNQKFTFFLCQAAAKQFIAQKSGGKIINIASMLSYQGGIRVPSYTASKSAVLGLTRAMANEWAKYNINVNGIAPGYMATNNTQALRNDDDRSDEILSRIPAGRWGTPADMAGAVVYLASAASDYVNGFTLAVDGGWLAR